MEQIKIWITAQPKNNNLGYLIDPTFTNTNRLFVFLFKNSDNVPTRDYFDDYYIPLLEIKDFNALIDNKPFFDQAGKSKQEAYEKLIKMSRNDGYTTGDLLGYLYHQKCYKFIGKDLPRQKKYFNHSSKIIFRGQLEEDDSARISYCWK